MNNSAYTTEQYIRSSLTNGWSDWKKIAVEEPGNQVYIITPPAETADYTAYPLGLSIGYLSTGSGWTPNGGYGTLITLVVTPYRVVQTFISNTIISGLTVHRTWQRLYYDGTGWGAWALMATPQDPTTMGITGEIKLWPVSTVPSGWLLCNGAAVNRTTYASLFALLGTTYGSGDGSTTFNVPNFKGRVPVGYDSTQTEFNAMGETGGEKTHTLYQDEMPVHNHTQDAHGHNMGQTGALTNGLTGTNNYAVTNGTYYTFRTQQPPSATPAIQNAGGGLPHNNIQPYITINYIIKT